MICFTLLCVLSVSFRDCKANLLATTFSSFLVYIPCVANSFVPTYTIIQNIDNFEIVGFFVFKEAIAKKHMGYILGICVLYSL